MFMIFTLAALGLPGTSGFVGEFLILLGAFKKSALVAVLASFGVIFAAAYMLWLYKRVVFGIIKNKKLRTILDLNLREVIIMVPLLIVVFIMGIFPNLFLDPMRLPIKNIIINYELSNGK